MFTPPFVLRHGDTACGIDAVFGLQPGDHQALDTHPEETFDTPIISEAQIISYHNHTLGGRILELVSTDKLRKLQ